ncbi:DUF805 domain-containing protein [Dickeya lacustris]|uniref:DUF805 domain-containing protein n=1 Tax=Dickeya lacustris TaxID=2259638 RepID=A0ABY8G3H7_9GAMM|nr:DUF805 domain-containing protein [Dickeya lacustris]WFN54500.1 DUF805 domain-containing protein [Dickeya lacustris]
MTIQQWCFSFRGRLGRRDFWLGMVFVLVLMAVLFVLADIGWLETQKAAFALVVLMWPLAAMLVKRLHDRDRKGSWALLLIVAWMLGSGNWAMLPALVQWLVERFIPVLIAVMMLLECGLLAGTSGANRFGAHSEPLRLRNSER